MDSIRKSFKTQPSYKHSRKTSSGGSGGDEDVHQEAQPILSDHNYVDSAKSTDSEDRGEVIVKIDANEDMGSDNNQGRESRGGGIWRDSSYEFWKDEDLISGGGGGNGNGSNVGSRGGGGGGGGGGNDAASGGNSKDGFYFQQEGTIDPPSVLIKQFLNKQNASGDKALDMDLEMDELQHDRTLPPIAESPTVRQFSKELRVSFQEFQPERSEINPEPVRYSQSSDFEDQSYNIGSSNTNGVGVSGRGIGGGGGGGGGRAQVLKCTSNVGFQKNYSLLRSKTKSRLMDPPPEEPQYMRSGLLAKSGQLKSGFLSSKGDDDDEDPFAEEDIPGEFRKTNLNALTILQWVSLILIIAAFICSLMIPSFVEMRLWELHLWKWELLVLVLICGRLLSGWGIRIAVFFIERNFLLRKRVLYFVYGVRKAVQNCLWLGLVLIAWNFMFDKRIERKVKNKVLPYVTKVLVCLLVGTLIWLVKTLLVKVLASSFHVSTYFDRIQDSLFNQYVIETLSGSPLLEFQKMQDEDEKVMAEIQTLQNAGATLPADLRATAFPDARSGRINGPGSGRVVGSGRTGGSGRVIGSGMLQRNSKAGKSVRFSGMINRQQGDGITIDHLHKMNQKNISAWNMKRLMNIVRHGVLSTLDERISDSNDDDSAMQIRNEFEAKHAAKAIFNNVAKRGSKYIYLQDLMRFMREDEALKTMNLFEGAKESKRVNKSALKNWVVNAFRERRALALTLNDTKTAVKKLHHIVNILVSIVIFVIWLLILEIATTHILVIISSQLVLAVFVFGNACKTTFEAIIFLFVMHPFDVGDRCEIDTVQMIVEEMNILTTVFLRYDNQKIIYPNSILATLPISNYYRSPDMGDTIEFCIHISTSAEKIALMKQRITSYVDSKPDIWYPSPMVVVKDVEDMNRVKIAVWLTHRMNHQDMAERWNRRANLVEEMIKIFRELDIEYRMLPLDMNVRNMPPCSSLRFPTNWTTCTN